MILVESLSDLRSALAQLPGPVGFVPTMGALHPGHASLMRQARAECRTVVVSIFVNPKQFGPQEDFSRYPRDLAGDSEVCRAEGVDVVFLPQAAEMYPPGFATEVRVGPELTDKLCGHFRPGHFEGVTTVVAKLFNLVRPDRAYFGQKDFQQVRVLTQMVADLAMPLELVRCPIVREADGLALSSRNRYLGSEERASALRLSAALGLLVASARAGEPVQPVLDRARAYLEADPAVRLQYFEVVEERTLEPATTFGPGRVALVAAYVGSTRLIDNALLDPEGPDRALAARAPKETLK
ncbi:MAG TPA: pantoate--beta-alanine ligase [Stenomitos sp.]